MPEILETEFPEPRWAVPGLIPIGLTLIAGRPKVGKSWMGLQLAHAKGTGGVFLGVKVERGDVLYLALEDSPRRLQTRSKQQGIPRTAAITFYTTWKPFHKGGLDDLLIELEAHNYSLVIIDTLERATPGTDKSDEKVMGPIFDQLQRMAQTRNMAIVLLDHHRKNGGFTNSVIDDVIGTTAKAGTADAIAGLYKEPAKREVTFQILGRAESRRIGRSQGRRRQGGHPGSYRGPASHGRAAHHRAHCRAYWTGKKPCKPGHFRTIARWKNFAGCEARTRTAL
jgi:RecA-family ATPase